MAKKKYRKLNYFFLKNEKGEPILHKALFISRPTDKIVAWNYPLCKRVVYTYSDVKKSKEPAFTTVEASRLLNRNRATVERAILRGEFPEPPHTYGIDENKKKYQYLWHEQDILAAHAYFMTVHRGRPRKDGRIMPQAMPTPRELRAMIRQEELLYIQNDNGEFVPVWKAPDFS